MMRGEEEGFYEAPRALPDPDPPVISHGSSKWTQLQDSIVLAETALQGKWEDDNTRALLWRLLLGVIPRAAPPSEWATEMSKKRDEYRSLKAEHRVDISKVVDETDANPLFSGSASGDDPWSHFYERKEMTDTIKADLERLFPTGCGDHFLAPARQELLLSVLSLWADLHPATGYRQGMHEVLAPLILALEKEVAAATRAAATRAEAAASEGMASEGLESGVSARGPLAREALGSEALAGGVSAEEASTSGVSASEAAAVTGSAGGARAWPSAGTTAITNGNPAEASTWGPGAAASLGPGSSPEELEADAFWLFDNVMKSLEGFYEHDANNGGGFGRRGEGGAGSRGGRDSGLDSPVVEMCKRLQGSRMRDADPELQKHLSDLDISPQLYGMKWARLMCGREFRVESVMLLWDHMFASAWLNGRPGLPECIENVAVSMVVSIRDQLLAEDCTGCLQLLMRYPPDQSVSTVIYLSLSLAPPQRGPSTASPGKTSGVSPGTAAERNASASSDSAPVWLMEKGRAGKDAGSGSPSEQRHLRAGAGREAERRRIGSDSAGGGGEGGRGGMGGVTGVLESTGGGAGWEGGNAGGGREVKNNWQQGLDDLTRRALSAAHGVAKMAVQTVERSQAAGGVVGGGGEGVSGSEAASLARRLRAACAALETGGASVNVALQEVKEVARLLDQRGGRGGQSGRAPDYRAAPVRVSGTPTSGRGVGRVVGSGGGGGGGGGSGTGGGGAITRAFSTYSEDDGCADGLYTRDL